MSAPPPGQSIDSTPKNIKTQYIRRSRVIDPLRPRKKPLKRPPPSLGGDTRLQSASETKLFYPVNGLVSQKISQNQQTHAQIRESNGGWTNKPEGDFSDFPLITTKRAVREGLRYHIARFSGKKNVDPWDQNEFTRPVILQRRDPQQPSGRGAKEGESENDQAIDSKEREKLEILRAEKEKQRVIDLAQIAPTGNNASALAAKKVISGRNEKTTQVYRLDKTEEEKKASDLRYEEALPWHVEDADNKNTWIGNYEAALSDINVGFIIQDGVFKMIPLEKWYKFTSKGQFKTYTIDEAEAKMGKKVKESRWVMKENELKEADRANLEGRRAMAKLYTVKSESTTFKNSRKRETEDMDELDFNGDDLFQDDDELATVEPDKDEETKEAQERIKKEQLGANVFDQANEAEIDKELFEIEKEAEVRKKFGKGVKKALKKRERNYIYDSDSDHPYSETSEDDTSDEEKVKEIDRRLEEENKNKLKTEIKVTNPDNSTKIQNTPVDRPKESDSLKIPQSRKRPGSPNLSESSGNESARKKSERKNLTQDHETTEPRTGSGQNLSSSQNGFTQNNRHNSASKLNTNQNRTSEIHTAKANLNPNDDNEAARDELSDRSKKRRKLKAPAIKISSNVSSRQGSPALGKMTSIAASSQASVTSPVALQRSGVITTSDIILALPAAGISIGNLMKSFGGRVGDDPASQTKKADFIKLVRENATYGPDKLLRPK